MIVRLSHPWKTRKPGQWIAGQPHDIDSFSVDKIDHLENLLRNQRLHFGVITEIDDLIFACVDRLRSYPVFYALKDNTLRIADNPHDLFPDLQKAQADTQAIALYLQSGYCHADYTFLKEVRQLQSGEYLLWDKQSKKLTIKAYYHYIPRFPDRPVTTDDRTALGQVLDEVTDRVIKQADGREIWIPLSGGLDSRAVLTKLHEHGYKKIQTFTYGAPGNTEAKTAQQIAAALDVPWRFITPDYKAQHEFVRSPHLDDFFRYTGRLSTAPTFSDFFALKTLKDQNLIGSHTFIVNGQSGDYITGAHLPVVPENPDSAQKIIEAFRKKHFSLWSSLRDFWPDTADIFLKEQRQKFEAIAPSFDRPYFKTYSFHPWLEWRERQSKYVVACQINYDYFGADWALPLWDSSLMDFYETMPLAAHLRSNLYIEYLQTWNYRNCFSFVREPINPWPRNRIPIVATARLIGVLSGQKNKESFYSYMRFWNSHDVHYQLMTINTWKKVWPVLEVPESVYNMAYWQHSGMAAPPDMKPSLSSIPYLFE